MPIMLSQPHKTTLFGRYIPCLGLFFLFCCTGSVFAQTDTDRRKEQIAQSYENSGDYRNSARLYQELYAAYPTSPDYFLGVVRGLSGLGQFASLLPIVEARSTQYPSVEVYGLYGELLWRTGRTKDAEAEWDKAINSAPQQEQTYSVLAQACIRARAPERAIVVLKEARYRLKNKTIFADELSQLLGSAGLYDEAVAETIGVLQRERNIAVAQARISAYLTNDKAIKETSKALESNASADRNNILVQYLYAWFLREIKQYSKALAVTRILDELGRAQGRELYNYAELARNEGFYEEAILAYNDVIAKGKNSAVAIAAVYGYVRALEAKVQRTMEQEQGEQIGNSATASQNIPAIIQDLIERYETIAKDYPQTPFAADALLRIALLYSEQSFEPEKTQSTLRRLLARYGGMEPSAMGYILLGKSYIAQARLTEAEDIFRQAVTALKNFPNQVHEAYFFLAEIMLYRGSIDTAQQLYQDLALKPNTDIANDALERLSLLQSVMNEKQRSALKLLVQAELREQQRRFDEALVLYRDAISIAPRSFLHERCLYRIARIYAQESRTIRLSTKEADVSWQSAIAVCDTLTRDFPDGVFADEAYLLWGKLLVSQAQRTEKQAEFLAGQTPTLADRQKSDTLKAQAKTYYADAIGALTQILIKFPKSPLAGEARKRIRLLRGDA